MSSQRVQFRTLKIWEVQAVLPLQFPRPRRSLPCRTSHLATPPFFTYPLPPLIPVRLSQWRQGRRIEHAATLPALAACLSGACSATHTTIVTRSTIHTHRRYPPTVHTPTIVTQSL